MGDRAGMPCELRLHHTHPSPALRPAPPRVPQPRTAAHTQGLSHPGMLCVCLTCLSTPSTQIYTNTIIYTTRKRQRLRACVISVAYRHT